MTIYELAEKAGVSIATISRALAPETSGKVAPDTIQKIRLLAKRYRYTPNFAARHLSKTAYQTVGVLFPHHKGMLASEYYSELISGIADCLLDSPYRMKMLLMNPDKKEEWDRYDFQNGEGVDGLITTYWTSIFSDPLIFNKIGIPVVVINNVENKIRARFVAGDHFEGGRTAAQYLYEKGHRRIAVFYGKAYSSDVQARYQGFRTFLRERNINLRSDVIFDVDYDERKSYEMTDMLLMRRPQITAVFCMNDAQAFGILKRLRERKLACPERISVMGYDDTRQSAYSQPRLTTFRVPVYELGKRAAESLILHLKGEVSLNDFLAQEYLPVSLVERETVRKI